MAKLTVDGGDSVAGDGGLFAMLASCGVLFCMISALMGIKIWWFKHRLSFDHSRTSNGAAGRATPTVPLRTRSNREKRISQEIHEPVEVHGIFRRRQENDLDIVPTKQLPPVRVRNLSQSTPALFPVPPPRRKDRVRSAIYEEYEPPTREPPRPQIESPPPPTPTISLAEEMPTFDELELKYRKMEITEKAIEQKRDSNESLVCMRDTPPQPPKRLNRHSYNEEKVKIGMHKFMKVKLQSTELTQSLQNVNDRRATGYLRNTEEDIEAGLAGNELRLNDQQPTRSHSVEEFGERRPTGYIKYEEIDADGLADFRKKWETLQTSFGSQSPASFQSTERIHYETLNDHDYDHTNHTSSTYHASKNPFVECNENRNWQASESFASNNATPLSQRSIDFTSDEEFADELGGFQPKAPLQLQSLDKSSEQEVFANFGSQSAETLSNARSTGNAKIVEPVIMRQKVRPEQLWNELEANIKQDEREKRLWHEIEKELDLNRDFANNIEEEFDKIRHSYEENEAGILETNCSLKRTHKQILISSPEPEGFGKNIDEDWASFENLAKNEKQLSHEAEIDKPIVQFNLADLEDAYDNETMLGDERHSIGFLRNSRKFTRELSKIEDEDEPPSPSYAKGIQFEELTFENDDTLMRQCSITDSDSQAVTNIKEDYVHEHTKDNIFEPVKDRQEDYVHEHTKDSIFKPVKDTQEDYVHEHTKDSILEHVKDTKEDYVHEHTKNSIFEPAEESLTVQTQARARPRPRQKVTFDFTSTEYIQTYGEEKEEVDKVQSTFADLLTTIEHFGSDRDLTAEDSKSSTTRNLPKAMQRITKIHYTSTQDEEPNTNTTEREISTTPSSTSSPIPVPPMLFGTKISLADAETDMNDSWTALEQNREVPTTPASTSPSSTPLTFYKLVESPTPSYHSPVTVQAVTVPSVKLTEEQVIIQHYGSSIKPHAAVRKQYFEQSDLNATEA